MPEDLFKDLGGSWIGGQDNLIAIQPPMEDMPPIVFDFDKRKFIFPEVKENEAGRN